MQWSDCYTWPFLPVTLFGRIWSAIIYLWFTPFLGIDIAVFVCAINHALSFTVLDGTDFSIIPVSYYHLKSLVDVRSAISLRQKQLFMTMVATWDSM